MILFSNNKQFCLYSVTLQIISALEVLHNRALQTGHVLT